MKFKVGDIVFVSNPDTDYEEEYGHRGHNEFFGKVTEINQYDTQTVVIVNFDPNNEFDEWAYNETELSLASDLKDMTLEEFSNKYGVMINAVYL